MTQSLSSIQRWIQLYFVVQAAGLGLWWLALFLQPDWIELFQPAHWPRDVLRSFALPDVLILMVGSLLVAASIQWQKTWSTQAIWSVAIASWYPTLYCIASSCLTGQAWIASALMVAMSGLSLALATIHGGSGEQTASFRVVHMRFVAAFLWTSIQIVIFWGTFLWVLPMGLLELERALGGTSFSHAGQKIGATILFAAASCVGLSSAIAMNRFGLGTPLPTAAASQLVVAGPYAWIRNPMACAGILQGIAVAWWNGSPIVLLYALLGGVCWHFLVRPVEESDLEQRFGQEYSEYRRRVGLWIPRWRRANESVEARHE
jgi:protein-S-isoprenylcysteine O-methyltransferase Ste14